MSPEPGHESLTVILPNGWKKNTALAAVLHVIALAKFAAWAT